MCSRLPPVPSPGAGPALQIGNVDPDGPMAAVGLQKGDRIRSVDGTDLTGMSRGDAAGVLKQAVADSMGVRQATLSNICSVAKKNIGILKIILFSREVTKVINTIVMIKARRRIVLNIENVFSL